MEGQARKNKYVSWQNKDHPNVHLTTWSPMSELQISEFFTNT